MNKRINVIWTISLIILPVFALLRVGLDIAGITMPDAFVRACGIILLLDIPLIVITSLKKRAAEKAEKE